VEVVASRLRAAGVMRDEAPARDATDEELLRVHARAYLDLVEARDRGIERARYLSTGDVVVDASSLASRAGRRAERRRHGAYRRKRPTRLALIRPPAITPSRSAHGICVFNNVAVAARAFQARHGGRVLVVDFDYHHGNGTERSRATVCRISRRTLSGISRVWNARASSRERRRRKRPDLGAWISTEAFVAIWEYALPRVARGRGPIDNGQRGLRFLAATRSRSRRRRRGGGAFGRGNRISSRGPLRRPRRLLLGGRLRLDGLTQSIAAIAGARAAPPTATAEIDRVGPVERRHWPGSTRFWISDLRGTSRH